MKKTLSNYKVVTNIIVAGLVVTTAIVIVNLGYNNFSPKTNVLVTPTAAETTNYNGTYEGNTDVAKGLANVTVSVLNGVLSGDATYIGVHSGFNITLPAKINGTVSETGVVTGTVVVSGTQYGQEINLNGPTNGQITNNNMDCSYSVSGNFGSYNGEIALVKN